MRQKAMTGRNRASYNSDVECNASSINGGQIQGRFSLPTSPLPTLLDRCGSGPVTTASNRSRSSLWPTLLLAVFILSGCVQPRIDLFPDYREPLKEFTLQGKGRDKILLIPVEGFISDRGRKSFLSRRPGVVQEVVAHLRKAERDPRVRAIIFKLNSPGGTTTASDILYQEILRYKKRTHKAMVALFMDLATSGAYYMALPCDWIVAHPTTVTGSIGAVFIEPQVTGLMDKLGITVRVYKSGENKDIGSPFRKMSAAETTILNTIIAQEGKRFVDLVARHRHLGPAAVSEISSARIYSAPEALRLGLVDQVGYLRQATRKAQQLAGISPQARVVVYRRNRYPDDNAYNSALYQAPDLFSRGTALPFRHILDSMASGFCYLWIPGAPSR